MRSQCIVFVEKSIRHQYPGLWQSELLKELFDQDVKIDYDILPFRCVDDFIGLPFRMAELNTWATMSVGPTNFRAKWTYGRARPEEVRSAAMHILPRVPLSLISALAFRFFLRSVCFRPYRLDGASLTMERSRRTVPKTF